MFGCVNCTIFVGSLYYFKYHGGRPANCHDSVFLIWLLQIEGNNADAGDAIMLDKDGYVSETNATNIVSLNFCYSFRCLTCMNMNKCLFPVIQSLGWTTEIVLRCVPQYLIQILAFTLVIKCLLLC